MRGCEGWAGQVACVCLILTAARRCFTCTSCRCVILLSAAAGVLATAAGPCASEGPSASAAWLTRPPLCHGRGAGADAQADQHAGSNCTLLILDIALPCCRSGGADAQADQHAGAAHREHAARLAHCRRAGHLVPVSNFKGAVGCVGCAEAGRHIVGVRGTWHPCIC